MRLKRTISALAALSLFAGCYTALPVSAASTDPVIKVTFDDGGSSYTLNGSAALADGRSGKALSLDGVDGYADISTAAAAAKNITGDYTISVWFKPENLEWWARVFDLGSDTNNYAFLSLGAPMYELKNGDSTQQSFSPGTALTAGVWQNVTISRSGNTTTFWHDGFETGSTTAINNKLSGIAAYTHSYLGRSQFTTDPYFKGLIDDFTVYDRALSVSEIQTLAAEAYTAKRDAKVAENNCYAADIKFYSGSNEIFAYSNESSIKAVVNVENDTMTAGDVTAKLFAVNGSTETELASSQISLQPAENTDITLTSSSVPSGTKKLIVKLTAGEDTYTAATLYSGISAPVAAPADSDTTTNGAHDPSIVKFPNDDTYYVYSSHNQIFTSTDLINWKKYDFTGDYRTNITEKNSEENLLYPNAKLISQKTYDFIYNNIDKNVNGTYWAPDVIYRSDDTAHPYWMYISVSCGLGGRNSAISLVKSPTPLFWADTDASKVNAIEDCGVVFATKEANQYKTNAIDANIYYDSADSDKAYFIWGSFWGGIQAAPLNSNGLIEGIDYTSDETILSSCQNFGTSVFTQKRGVAGPEGAWMIEHGDYRYLVTSYAWLGSNYHTRVARSPLSTKFSVNTGTQLLDANNVVMGTQYSSSTGEVTKAQITGYKLIGSYRLGDGSASLTENEVNSWYYPRESGDAHVYYGPGHNSVINIGNETFYVSHTRKDYVEGAATLQVRKVLFTSDGWPVVSPVTYAGEKEQALPAEMIKGTYDLASVGVTKFAPGTNAIDENFDNHSGNRNYDLPVISSKVTLGEDNKVTNKGGAQIGTWAFDNDHTVTITFSANGDTSKDEFYKSGDVMTLYALYGYDKDEAEPVVALTGTDQNHVTQFAKKSTQIFKTPSATIKSDPISITKSAGGNPELGFDADGSILYAGDPAATVIGDTVYLICGHDTSEDEAYQMPEWVLYTSKNMTDWEYKGVVMRATDISWRNTNTDAWASQMVEYGGKYYLYYCTWDKTSEGKMSIGVAVASSPEGPYTDALGKPLVAGTFTTPESSGWNDIDPTVLIDTVDGVEHRYLAWGNGKYYICELNENMTSVKDIDGDGQIIMHKDIKERPVKSMNGGVYTEAPWLYKRDGKYYLFYAMNWREEMAYAMCDDPMGRYDFKQIIMPPTATSNTNHPSVIDFGGKTYFIYHNGALPHGSGFRRSVCIDELKFDENGYVYPVTETSIGLTGTASAIKSSSNKYIGHAQFTNSLADSAYPISAALTAESAENGYNTAWEIVPAKAVPGSENAENYVSLQSVNKPGLYITSNGSGVTLTQDTLGTSGSAMTFKTVKGIDGNENTVSFESVSDAGKYLTVLGSGMTLSYGVTPADCSFVISGATAKDPSVISVAAVEPEPAPEAAITQSFDELNANTTLIYLNKTDSQYTDIKGLTLYIGSKESDPQTGQNFKIQSGGVTGNALVLNTGKYQSSSRGPRMAIYTPVIPNGYTATAEIKVKQGAAGSVLRYNDSTTAEAGTDIAGLSTDWQTFKVTITNDNDTYTRCMYLGDTKLNEDYIGSFPVLWGTTSNSTGQSIYLDDLTIKTTDANGETPLITVPDPAAWFRFDNDLNDSKGNGAGTLTGSTVGAAATATAAAYVEGKSGKAVSFTGAGSYGVELPVKPSGSNYTISFDAKITASTQYSPFVFMANYDNGAIKGDVNAQWVSICPQGWQDALASGPMVWSRNVPGGAAWNDLYKADNDSVTTGKWYNITVAAKGAEAKLYVDKELVAAGPIADIVDSTTKMYLGVNAWDTPFNGAIDNLMLFNETLSADQVALIDTVGAAARIGSTSYATIDAALEAAKDGDTIELLSDVTATIACPKAVTINGHGYKYTFAPTDDWQLALGTTVDNKKVVINNATVSLDYAANDHVDFARGGTTPVELNNVIYDNIRPAWSVMVDAVDMKNSKINGFQGFTVIANWIGDSINIANSEIKDAKVGNGIGAVLLGINGVKDALNAVITDSVITGTKNYVGDAPMPDVCLGSGTLTLKGSTVIGELKKTGGTLTLDSDFKGTVKVTGLTIADGTEVAAVNDGADVSGVTVGGMTEEFVLKTENGKLVIAAAPAEPTPAPISGKVDEGAETSYATLQELVNAAGTETEKTVTITGEAADQGDVTVPEKVTLKIDENASLKNTVINAKAGKTATVEVANTDGISTITADSITFGSDGKVEPSDGAVISTPNKEEPELTDKGFVKTKKLNNESSVTFSINNKEYTAEVNGSINGEAIFCIFVTAIPEGKEVTVDLD